jgi:hypothetical protein
MKAINLEKLLPADIPQGERVLWFGRPEPVSLWRRAYRADVVGVWFLAMAVWNLAGVSASDGALAGFVSALRTLGSGAAAMAILALLAWASARTTLYVVTERRIVVKTGIALPIFINVPFKQISGANLRAYADGSGEVTIALTDGQRIPYLALWPSARPLRFARPEPALRCVAGARDIAATLGRALADAANQPPMAPVRGREAAGEPAAVAAAAA